jgi:hypothetical protein
MIIGTDITSKDFSTLGLKWDSTDNMGFLSWLKTGRIVGAMHIQKTAGVQFIGESGH